MVYYNREILNIDAKSRKFNPREWVSPSQTLLHEDDDARCHCTRVRYCSPEILRKEDSKIPQRKGGKSRGIFQHPDSSHISVKILRKKVKKRWGKKKMDAKQVDFNLTSGSIDGGGH